MQSQIFLLIILCILILLRISRITGGALKDDCNNYNNNKVLYIRYYIPTTIHTHMHVLHLHFLYLIFLTAPQ